MKIKPYKFIKRLFPDMIWEIDDRNGVFLTFDDGPTPGITEWILATLKRYDAKATFFVLGKNAELYPDLYRRILDEGHKIGNHTYSHQKGWGMPLEKYIEDVDFADDILPPSLRPRDAVADARRGAALQDHHVEHPFARLCSYRHSRRVLSRRGEAYRPGVHNRLSRQRKVVPQHELRSAAGAGAHQGAGVEVQDNRVVNRGSSPIAEDGASLRPSPGRRG